jgi:acetolactate synthase I/II/III large subunit
MARVSELFVRALKNAGVSQVFGIPSIHNIGLYEALREEPSIKHILCRHESSATHMADGYARAGKGAGVVITSTGPGAGYMAAPLVEAWGSSSPVLAVTTNIATDQIGRGTATLHRGREGPDPGRSLPGLRQCRPARGGPGVPEVKGNAAY